MAIGQASQRMTDKIVEILSDEGKLSCVYTQKCTFTNPQTGFTFEPRYIKQLNIQQDFTNSYMDMMTMKIEVRPKELKDLLTNMNGLEVNIILQPIDVKDLWILYDRDPIIIDAKVFQDQQVDLEKAINVNNIENATAPEEAEDAQNSGTPDSQQATIEYEFHMLEPAAYNLRHRQMNATFNGANMESTIQWIAQALEVENIKIVPPDNKDTYENLVIPPGHDISSVLPYLQERSGIYSKGLGYYICNKTLYIYPSFDTDRNTSPVDNVVHILNAPPDYYLGIDHYHREIDGDVWVVSTSKAELQPLNTQGTENAGNVHVSMNSYAAHDGSTNMDRKTGEVTRDPSSTLTVVTLQNEAGNMSPDMQNVKYMGERNNIYSSTTAMAAANLTMLNTAWQKATPWILEPGKTLVYHYDGRNGEYKTQTGRIMKLSFQGDAYQSHEVTKPWISFTCSIVGILEADQQSPDTVQQNN